MSGTTDGAPDATTGYLVSDLVSMALRQIGVGAMGTTARGPDTADGIMHLNMMLAQWQRKRWLVPNLVDEACMSTGSSIYYIGPGVDIDVAVRPSQILSAYARLLNGASAQVDGDFVNSGFSPDDFFSRNTGIDGPGYPIDYPLVPIPSYEDYASLGMKALKTWPNYYHYNPAFPLGEFRPWPIPQAGVWELHVLYARPLPAVLSADMPINLPPEYWDAIMWSLAARMAPSYGQEASQTVLSAAKAALNTIRSANQQIPTLGMPAILTPIGNPFYWPSLETQRL